MVLLPKEGAPNISMAWLSVTFEANSHLLHNVQARAGAKAGGRVVTEGHSV